MSINIDISRLEGLYFAEYDTIGPPQLIQHIKIEQNARSESKTLNWCKFWISSDETPWCRAESVYISDYQDVREYIDIKVREYKRIRNAPKFGDLYDGDIFECINHYEGMTFVKYNEIYANCLDKDSFFIKFNIEADTPVKLLHRVNYNG